MDLLPDLATLTDDALDALVRELEAEEEAVSLRRRLLHGHIDLLRGERGARLRAALDAGTAELAEPGAVAETVAAAGPAPDPDAGIAADVAPLPDPAELGDDELRDRIRALEREEDEASLRRRILHGQIDILKAERELRRRGHTAHVDVDRLSEILSERLLARPEPE